VKRFSTGRGRGGGGEGGKCNLHSGPVRRGYQGTKGGGGGVSLGERGHGGGGGPGP
jgi:hypothetical protein